MTDILVITDMHVLITALEVKLRLWEAHLANAQFVRFPRIAACGPEDMDL